jgi:hypothetical protein
MKRFGKNTMEKVSILEGKSGETFGVFDDTIKRFMENSCFWKILATIKRESRNEDRRIKIDSEFT